MREGFGALFCFSLSQIVLNVKPSLADAKLLIASEKGKALMATINVTQSFGSDLLGFMRDVIENYTSTDGTDYRKTYTGPDGGPVDEHDHIERGPGGTVAAGKPFLKRFADGLTLIGDDVRDQHGGMIAQPILASQVARIPSNHDLMAVGITKRGHLLDHMAQDDVRANVFDSFLECAPQCGFEGRDKLF